MALATNIGATILAAAMAAIPGCVVRLRVTGAEFDGWRATPAKSGQDGQYGAHDGVTATVRVPSTALPGGVTITDAMPIDAFENGVEWITYRVNGLSTTMGMYRFELADAMT